MKVALTTHLRTQISALKPQTSNLKSQISSSLSFRAERSGVEKSPWHHAARHKWEVRFPAHSQSVVYRLSSIICRLIISILPLPHLCYNN